MPPAWREYQEETASWFRSLGLEAKTDVTLQGVRTTHDIDVVVKSRHAGFEIVWIVECKLWKVAVSKLHVLALREIVADLGVDRGILLSEQGFQSGAIEASKLTNVQVTSLASLIASTSEDVFAMRLRELYDRIEECKRRYWDIPKSIRIDRGLRPDLGGGSYSGANEVDLRQDLVARAFRGIYPIVRADLRFFFDETLPLNFENIKDVVTTVDLRVTTLEEKLKQAGG